MVKKILSLTVAIMLLSVTAFATVTPIALAQESEAATGETKEHTFYNTVNGSTAKGDPVASADNANLTERIALHKLSDGSASFGTNNQTGLAIQIGKDSTYYRSALLRFPLNIPQNEEVKTAKLVLTASKTISGELTLKAYKSQFTNAKFGTAMSKDDLPSYSVLTNENSLIGTAEKKTEGTTQYSNIEIDITDHIKDIAGEGYADIAVADPNANTFHQFYSVLNSSISTMTYKPRLVITTMVDPTYGLPAIDTVANEGKTKIRMQTQSDVTFSNDTCGLLSGNGATASYEVNCKTAGKYYFGVYTTDRYVNTASRKGKLKVNTGEEQEVTFVQSGSNNGWNSNGTVPTGVNNALYLNCFEVDLIAGKNTITITSASSYLGFAYVELTNYARANAGAETKSVAEKGIEVVAATQPISSVIDYPTVVYKVYDSIEAAGVTSGNVAIQVSGTGTDSSNCFYIAASYDSSDCIKEVKLLQYPCLAKATRNLDMGEFNLSGVDYINVFAFDATTLEPIATTFGTIN